MFQYSAKVIRWVDGDTAWLDIDLGFYTHRLTDVRLAKINAPERVQYTAQGIVDPVLEHNQNMCPPGAEVIADITTRDKYGRWLAVIRYRPGNVGREDILQNGRELNQELLELGLVKPYKK